MWKTINAMESDKAYNRNENEWKLSWSNKKIRDDSVSGIRKYRFRHLWCIHIICGFSFISFDYYYFPSKSNKTFIPKDFPFFWLFFLLSLNSNVVYNIFCSLNNINCSTHTIATPSFRIVLQWNRNQNALLIEHFAGNLCRLNQYTADEIAWIVMFHV